MKSPLRQYQAYAAAALIAAAVFVPSGPAGGETLDELKQAIDAKNQEIKKLEEEAAAFQRQIRERQTQARTLTGELGRIDATIAKIRRDINVTTQRARKKELEIKELGLEIGEREEAIEKVRLGMASMIRALRERDETSLIAALVRHGALSGFLRQFDESALLQERFLGALGELRALRRELAGQKSDAEKKRAELTDLRENLTGQRGVQEEQKKARGELLSLTRNQEKQYQKMLQDNQTRQAALEQEIRGIEEKIRVTIDASLLPSKGTGVLGHPLPNVVLSPCTATLRQDPGTNCITQYFGSTSFAAAGAYRGQGHNGMDFRAEIGTSVFSAERGTVTAVGDTDAGCRGASYGKWILVRHPNNLSTLYAHLSTVGVAAGEDVHRGGRIGYSGMTGYATGPHLHVTVFATQGVRVQDIRSRVCGRAMTLPVAGRDPVSGASAYLNPLDYL